MNTNKILELLRAELKKRLKNVRDYMNGAGMRYKGPKYYKAQGKESAYDALLNVIDSLQQEQSEIENNKCKPSDTVLNYVLNDLCWKVDVPSFLKEAHDGSKSSPYSVTFNILFQVLQILAMRAQELNDPALNIIMLNLSLFDGSHDRSFYNKAVMSMREKIKQEAK